jgi:DDE superfamily endonuclease
VRVLSQAERRFGLLTGRRRRLTAWGVQPVGSLQHVFEWCYGSGAVAPTTGERFFVEPPYLHAENVQRFINLFAQAFPDRLHLRLLDNSGAHTAHQLTIPEHVRLVYWPPDCPELNPIERGWRDLKDALAWLQFPTLEAV